MTSEEVKRIIKEENLKQYRIWDDQIRVNEVVIIKMNGKYQVFSTDERCARITEKTFDTEDEAFDNFIRRLRALNRLLKKNKK